MISDEPRVLIRAEGMCKCCKLGTKSKEAVVDFDIKIMRGEFVLLEGLYGLEKNSFFSALGCLERPYTGKYYFDYEDVALADSNLLDGLRKYKIGYLFRDYRLIPSLSVMQNVEVPLIGSSLSPQEKKVRIADALQRFDMLKLADKKACEISNFEKQLTALARAIVNNPLVILADEPGANLDTEEEKLIIQHIIDLNSEGVSVLLFTEKKTMQKLNKYRTLTFSGGRLCSDKEAYKLSLVRREA